MKKFLRPVYVIPTIIGIALTMFGIAVPELGVALLIAFGLIGGIFYSVCAILNDSWAPWK